MNDDPLMRRLAQVQREELDAEQASLDERWDRLSAGELSPEDEAELRALAETSEDARQAYEAFRPLGPEFQARVVGALQEQRVAPELEEGPRPPARVLPFRKLATRLGGSLAAAAAVAAALVLLLRVPGSQPPMPGYELEVTGGAQEMRGDQPDRLADSPSQTFSPGSQIELVARPQTAVTGPVAARCFLERDGALQPWEVSGEITGDGVVRIAGTVGREITIPPGEWTLWIVVGRPGTLPDAAALSAHPSGPPPGNSDWILRKAPLRAE